MLHAKFQNHRPSGSEEEDFKGFCCLKPWRPSWSYDVDYLYKLSFPLTKDLSIKFAFDWPSYFRKDNVWLLWSYICI